MTTTATLAVSGMHCSSCGLLIDETLEELGGIARASTDVGRGRTDVSYDVEAVTLTTIVEEIGKLGNIAAPV